MSPAARALLIIATAIGPLGAPAAAVPLLNAQETAPECREPQECQRLALAAESDGDYGRFHDLAWRAVQTGPRNDHALMFLLARAQARSGRPHDALVMLQRLAEAGARVDASEEAFARTRELPGWPAVEALLANGTASPAGSSSSAAAASPPRPAPADARPARPAAGPDRAAPPAPANAPGNSAAARPGNRVAPTVAPTASAGEATAAVGGRIPSSPAGSPAAAGSATAPGGGAVTAAASAMAPARPALARVDAARFSAPRFTGGGFAYDVVSQRFVIGDALAKKLVVVGVGGAEPTDMVRADSAGFEDVSAVEIDERRGDLWVAGAAGAVHRLQLVSGRPLKTYRPPASSGAVDLVDLAVAPTSGTVFGLDATGGRLLALTRGAEQWEVSTPLDATAPASLALQDETTAFVAHASGLSRVDLRGHRTSAVAVADGLDLRGIERLRAFHGSLLAVQRASGGSWRLLRLTLNGSRRVTTATILDEIEGLKAPADAAGKAPFIALAGDELYYVSSGDGSGAYVVRRLTLR